MTEANDEALIKCLSAGVLDVKDRKGKERVTLSANRFCFVLNLAPYAVPIIHLLSRLLIRNRFMTRLCSCSVFGEL